jgi:hypothetical protein
LPFSRGTTQCHPLGRTGYQVPTIGPGYSLMMILSLAAGAKLVRRTVELGLNYDDNRNRL